MRTMTAARNRRMCLPLKYGIYSGIRKPCHFIGAIRYFSALVCNNNGGGMQLRNILKLWQTSSVSSADEDKLNLIE